MNFLSDYRQHPRYQGLSDEQIATSVYDNNPQYQAYSYEDFYEAFDDTDNSASGGGVVSQPVAQGHGAPAQQGYAATAQQKVDNYGLGDFASDSVDAIQQGAYGAAADFSEFVDQATSWATGEEFKTGATGWLRNQAAAQSDDMSDAGRAQMEGFRVTTDDGLGLSDESTLAGFGLNAMSGVGSMGAFMVPAGAIAKGASLAGKAVGLTKGTGALAKTAPMAVGLTASNAATIGGGNFDSTYNQTMAADYQDLNESNDYKKLYWEIHDELKANGESIDHDTIALSAKKMLATKAGHSAMWEGAGLGATTGALSAVPLLNITLGRNGSGYLSSILKAGAIEGSQEFVESGGESIITNRALKEFVNSDIEVTKGVLSDALTGMTIGAGTGSGATAIGRPLSRLTGMNPPPQETQEEAKARGADLDARAEKENIDSLDTPEGLDIKIVDEADLDPNTQARVKAQRDAEAKAEQAAATQAGTQQATEAQGDPASDATPAPTPTAKEDPVGTPKPVDSNLGPATVPSVGAVEPLLTGVMEKDAGGRREPTFDESDSADNDIGPAVSPPEGGVKPTPTPPVDTEIDGRVEPTLDAPSQKASEDKAADPIKPSPEVEAALNSHGLTPSGIQEEIDGWKDVLENTGLNDKQKVKARGIIHRLERLLETSSVSAVGTIRQDINRVTAMWEQTVEDLADIYTDMDSEHDPEFAPEIDRKIDRWTDKLVALRGETSGKVDEKVAEEYNNLIKMLYSLRNQSRNYDQSLETLVEIEEIERQLDPKGYEEQAADGIEKIRQNLNKKMRQAARDNAPKQLPESTAAQRVDERLRQADERSAERKNKNDLTEQRRLNKQEQREKDDKVLAANESDREVEEWRAKNDPANPVESEPVTEPANEIIDTKIATDAVRAVVATTIPTLRSKQDSAQEAEGQTGPQKAKATKAARKAGAATAGNLEGTTDPKIATAVIERTHGEILREQGPRAAGIYLDKVTEDMGLEGSFGLSPIQLYKEYVANLNPSLTPISFSEFNKTMLTSDEAIEAKAPDTIKEVVEPVVEEIEEVVEKTKKVAPKKKPTKKKAKKTSKKSEEKSEEMSEEMSEKDLLMQAMEDAMGDIGNSIAGAEVESNPDEDPDPEPPKPTKKKVTKKGEAVKAKAKAKALAAAKAAAAAAAAAAGQKPDGE